MPTVGYRQHLEDPVALASNPQPSLPVKAPVTCPATIAIKVAVRPATEAGCSLNFNLTVRVDPDSERLLSRPDEREDLARRDEGAAGQR
jgi:hypothetical protein